MAGRNPRSVRSIHSRENRKAVTPMSVQAKKIPTAQDVLGEQDLRPPAIVPAQTAKLPAMPSSRTAAQAYYDEVAPVSIVGRMVKFDTKGKCFITSDDEAKIADDEDFVVLADQTLDRYIKFNGKGEPPDRIMGLLYDGFVKPHRDELSDRDQSKWEIGLDGKPADPWQHHTYLVLQKGGTAELFTFVTSSATGHRAIGNLLRHYDRMQRTNPGEYPVVRLKVGGFEHRDARVGWVATPVFTVVGRAPRDSVATPDTSLSADMNDEVPW
jgi:hypothetical protein